MKKYNYNLENNMEQSKDIIWQMSRDYNPPKCVYVVGFDAYQEEKPLNFWNKIKKKLGLKYKRKESNSIGVIGKIETINGKKVVSYDTNR